MALVGMKELWEIPGLQLIAAGLSLSMNYLGFTCLFGEAYIVIGRMCMYHLKLYNNDLTTNIDLIVKFTPPSQVLFSRAESSKEQLS